VDRSASSAGLIEESVVRCRQIGGADVDAIIGLLMRGMPGRPLEHWRKGFERLKKRHLQAGVPRYGLLLESDGSPVGAILLIYADAPSDLQGSPRCNLSSWYVAIIQESGFASDLLCVKAQACHLL
jgi:hypothetical protein